MRIGFANTRRQFARPWWPAAAKVVYVPAGAESAAAAKVNLARPGTYDADGDPESWSALGGWRFNNGQVLDTGYMPPNTQARGAAVAFASGAANRSNNTLFGCGNSNLSSALLLASFEASSTMKGSNSSGLQPAGEGATAGVVGMNGAYIWKNGLSIGGPANYTSHTPTTNLLVGGVKFSSSFLYCIANIRALVAWEGTLSDDEMVAMMEAMAEL